MLSCQINIWFQAAIGPLALDTARELNASDDVMKVAEQILTIAVLSILITAPLGAAAIGLTGPSLLQCDGGSDQPSDGKLLCSIVSLDLLPSDV